MHRESYRFLRPNSVRVNINALMRRGLMVKMAREVRRVMDGGEQLRRAVRRTPEMIDVPLYMRDEFFKRLSEAEARAALKGLVG